MNNKKTLILMSAIILMTMALGTAYAFFNYTKVSSRSHQAIAGEINLTYNEEVDTISINTGFPETNEEARNRNDNFITFTISGKNESNKDINYEVDLIHGEEVSGKNRIDDKYLKFDLEETINDTTTIVVAAGSYQDLSNYVSMWTNSVPANTTTNITKTYKLRMWISDEVLISDTEINAAYTTSQFKTLFASIKVRVLGDFAEHSYEDTRTFGQKIASLASSKNYINNYDDRIANNPTLTTHDQVSDSSTKQTVYYYSGSDAVLNANVLFAGYCWQIVRTTDNGGVRMIYNGPVTVNGNCDYSNYYDIVNESPNASSLAVNSSYTYYFGTEYSLDRLGNFILSGTITSGNWTEANSSNYQRLYTCKKTSQSGTCTTLYRISSENQYIDETHANAYSLTAGSSTIIKGINAVGEHLSQTMTGTFVYGRSFDYDLESGNFTIEDSQGLPTSWSTNDANNNGMPDYRELIGTYTCMSSSSTCTTLYYVGSIMQTGSRAYVAKYKIGDVAHYSQIGTSPFNANRASAAMVGYMFNDEYSYRSTVKSGEYYATATWNGTSYELTDGNNGTAPDATHHYICDSDCTKVRYYYWSLYYILLENGINAEDALYRMVGYGTTETKGKEINHNYKLNNYNSAVKGYLDNWYKKNLISFSSYIDQTSVYCNNRTVRELGGWNPNGTNLGTLLGFNSSNTINLDCVNEIDRFSVMNTSAKLNYPIALLTEPERSLMNASYEITGQEYLSSTPSQYGSDFAYLRYVDDDGGVIHSFSSSVGGVRAVITLKPSVKLEGGTGTNIDPYVVGPIVERTD